MDSANLAAAHPTARPPARTVTTIPLQPRGLRGKKSVRPGKSHDEFIHQIWARPQSSLSTNTQKPNKNWTDVFREFALNYNEGIWLEVSDKEWLYYVCL